MPQIPNRYSLIIEGLFFSKYNQGDREVKFKREEIISIAEKQNIKIPLNLGDIIYSFRYRTNLPDTIIQKADEGFEWVIHPAGKGEYKFILKKKANFLPNTDLVVTKIPDSTPGIVSKYSLDDEQALLAKIRYNRLIDIFTGVTCYSLQNHLRTSISGIGQVETDEIYLGIDMQGIHYVFTVQAKGGTDKIGAVQIEQDFAVCSEKFSNAVARPIAAQFMSNETIVLFEFVLTEEGVRVATEKHYKLVPSDELSDAEISEYRKHSAR